jgi:cellulase/cellobiase CelA1
VTNSGGTPTAGWAVGYSWPGSQTISQIWSATQTQAGAAVTIGNLSYNGALPVNGSTTFGLIGTGAAPSTLPSLRCTAH